MIFFHTFVVEEKKQKKHSNLKFMKKSHLITLFFWILTATNLTNCYCQDLKLRLQTRMGYLWNDQDHGKASCELLSVAIDGSITPEFTFSAFQHLNRFDRATKDNPLAATDWLYLSWRRKNIQLSAGKQMLEYGGQEYDAAPIDLYGTGVYYNNFEMAFAYSFNASYWIGQHKLTAQVAEIPIPNEHNDVAVSLSWRGKMNWYEAKHSVNAIGQGSQRPVLSNVVLGNIFHFRRANFYLDLINRWNKASVRLFQDFSIVACANIQATPWMNVRLKYNYDYNEHIADRLCPTGTHQSQYLGGLEFFPLKDDRIRLHISCKHNQHTYISTGFTWRIYAPKISLKKSKDA